MNEPQHKNEQIKPGQIKVAEMVPADGYCQVRECESQVLRACDQCDGHRQAVACRRESSPWLFHDRFVTWRCNGCHNDMNLLSGETVVLRIVVLLAIVGLIAWLAMQGGLLSLLAVFTKISWVMLPAALAVLLLVSAILTAWHSLVELVQDFRLRLANPRISGPSGWARLGKTLVLGLLPLALALGLGLLDHFVYDINEILAFLVLPLIFSPIFLAHRLGLSQMGTFLAALFWFALLGMSLFFAEPVWAKGQTTDQRQYLPLWIEAEDHRCFQVRVELAANRAVRRKGLMMRDHMGEEEGMLFIWDYPHTVRMWMDQTLIPLDMWFVDEHGQVTQIDERRDTQSTRISRSAVPVPMVLELNAGYARQRGISPGEGMRIAMTKAQRQALSGQLSEQMLSYLSASLVQCDLAEE